MKKTKVLIKIYHKAISKFEDIIELPDPTFQWKNCLSILPSMCLFRWNHYWSRYYTLDTVLGAGFSRVNSRDRCSSCPHWAYSPTGKTHGSESFAADNGSSAWLGQAWDVSKICQWYIFYFGRSEKAFRKTFLMFIGIISAHSTGGSWNVISL